MYFATTGNREKQIEHIRKAIAHPPTTTDLLIAMYRVPNPDEAWSKDAKTRIDAWGGELRKEIRNYEDFLQRPLDDQQRIQYSEIMSHRCNELAWLLSNTDGDLQEALRNSQRSLELVPETP